MTACLILCLTLAAPQPPGDGHLAATPAAQPHVAQPPTDTAAAKPHVVMLIAEREYHTDRTLAEFAERTLEPAGLRCTVVAAAPDEPNRLVGPEAIAEADLLLVSVRRRALPAEQLRLIRRHVEAGKPLVGIRTASHAFAIKGKPPEGGAQWPEFDAAVLGGNYHGHTPKGATPTISVAPGAAGHPVLAGLPAKPFPSTGTLYLTAPLRAGAKTLLVGRTDAATEPVAWTHESGGARVFYTSLGHEGDFARPELPRLLKNAILWGLEREGR